MNVIFPNFFNFCVNIAPQTFADYPSYPRENLHPSGQEKKRKEKRNKRSQAPYPTNILTSSAAIDSKEVS